MASRYVDSQLVIRAAGVESCSLLVILHRLFKLLGHEELAGGKV